MNKKLEFPQGSKPVSNELVGLLDRVQECDSDQLFWLSGYCSGIAAERNQVNVSKSSGVKSLTENNFQEDSKTNVALKTMVLYGSQTGNGQSLADSLMTNLSHRGLSAEISSLNEFKSKQIKQQQIVLLIASTHGEGEPPDDAIEFHDFIHSKRAPSLSGLKHAVLALGDSSYEQFCQTGKDFDNAFTKLGSEQLLERLDCDLDYESSANEWIDRVVEKIASLSPADSDSSANVNDNANAQNISVSMNSNGSLYDKNNPFKAMILANQKITGRGSVKEINHIEISLEGSDISYLPGDSLGVWARNNQNTVGTILSICQLNAEQEIEFKGKTQSIEKALTESLEISLINKGFVNKYAEIVEKNSPKKAKHIKSIAAQNYSGYIKNHQIVDILASGNIALDAQQLVDLLKPIKPRMYSISSSLEANPDEVHITVALKEDVNEKSILKGTASQFLIESSSEDDELLVFVETNKRFKLPSSDTPIIMIGPGTGIAPFRAFLQEREEKSATGDNWLFFGNPNFNTDFLYQVELQKYVKDGVLTHFDVAFSRDQEDKIYVQDRLLENANNVWHWLADKSASIYVCGDMNHMAKDVDKALLKIISQQGNKSKVQAEEFLKLLKKENRYQRDVY